MATKIVGFIDYYLNEWHADNYPAWIHDYSNGEFEVKYAYAMVEPTIEGRISNTEWAAKYGIELVPTIAELIEKCDGIIVLSPDNSEMHYELSREALESGKPVYIDKTFADTAEEARRIFAVGEQYGAPCFSSSALRFSEKLTPSVREDIDSIVSTGGGHPETYLIHQLEPVVTLMGSDVTKLMYIGTPCAPAWVLRFADGRTATVTQLAGPAEFVLQVNHGGAADCNETVLINDGFFKGLINAILHMFRTGEIPVSHHDTIGIMSIRETCLKAMDTPDVWLDVQ